MTDERWDGCLYLADGGKRPFRVSSFDEVIQIEQQYHDSIERMHARKIRVKREERRNEHR